MIVISEIQYKAAQISAAFIVFMRFSIVKNC